MRRRANGPNHEADVSKYGLGAAQALRCYLDIIVTNMIALLLNILRQLLIVALARKTTFPDGQRLLVDQRPICGSSAMVAAKKPTWSTPKLQRVSHIIFYGDHARMSSKKMHSASDWMKKPL